MDTESLSLFSDLCYEIAYIYLELICMSVFSSFKVTLMWQIPFKAVICVYNELCFVWNPRNLTSDQYFEEPQWNYTLYANGFMCACFCVCICMIVSFSDIFCNKFRLYKCYNFLSISNSVRFIYWCHILFNSSIPAITNELKRTWLINYFFQVFLWSQ